MASRISAPFTFATLRRRQAALGAAGFLLLGGLGLLSSSGCTLSTAGIDDGSGGTSSTTTGTGGAPDCLDDSKCSDGNPCTKDICNKGKCENPPDDTIEPTDPNPCTKDVCKDGVASHTNLPAGTPCGTALKCDAGGVCRCTTNEQCGMTEDCVKPTCDPTKGCVMVLPTDIVKDKDPKPNDCQGIKCDGMGHAVSYNEDMDKPLDDGVVCTDDACMNGMPVHPASMVGSPCMGSKVCKAAGVCVFCTGNVGCDVAGGEYCFNETSCASCTNASKDGDETDVGCGGTTCPKCDDGKSCLIGADCKNNKCKNGVCVSCMDLVQNDTETDVDCGGSCPKCENGKVCVNGSDCMSGKCSGNKCVSCSDNIKNGDESDVDCGGSCPSKCATGKGCGAGGDCTLGFCAEGVCCATACGGTCLSCNLPGKPGACGVIPSGVPDPGTCGGGMLCDGGGTCANNGGKKAVGGTCGADSDCFNNTCQGICKLAIGNPCAANSDCETFLCSSNVCTACASSADCPGNNACGGGKCKLPDGEPCKSNPDCKSNNCGGAGNPKTCQ